MTTTTDLRIGLFGAGIVGGGVCELIQKFTSNGRFGNLGFTIEIVKICVRSPENERDFNSSRSYTYVSDRNDIINDTSINCVVEVMGGITDAKDIVLAAIRAGKHVISANKALIANYLEEIQAELAANPSVQ
jgi:homoserine dehydrogenase